MIRGSRKLFISALLIFLIEISLETNSSKKKFSFIDAGCGNGWLVEYVNQMNNCTFCSGVDGSNSMIEKARLNYPDNIYFNSNIESWIPEKTVDFVFSMEVIYYLNNPKNFENLLIELKEKKCSIFMGPSGVGKTTLLNMIIPGLDNTTAPVSSKIKRGKNTTRNVELFSLSTKSYIVDTPGFNIQSLEIDIRELPNLYPEIYEQVVIEGINCKFRNCLHVNDQGCKLNKNFERYIFYKEMIESSKSHYYLIQGD